MPPKAPHRKPAPKKRRTQIIVPPEDDTANNNASGGASTAAAGDVSPAATAERSSTIFYQQSSMASERSAAAGGGPMSPEDMMRRRGVELDERRAKEWNEYQRVYRRDDTSSTNPKVFLDIAVGDAAPQRIVIELFVEQLPKTCENFRELCVGAGGWDGNHGCTKLDLADTKCSRIVPGIGAVFGDLNGMSLSATGGYSNFADENFSLRHNARGIVTMVSHGPNTLGSHFMILFDRVPQLDFKNVPFGRVCEGMPVLEKLEHHVPTREITHVPTVPVVITLCGALNGKKPPPVTPPPGVSLTGMSASSTTTASAPNNEGSSSGGGDERKKSPPNQLDDTAVVS